MLPNLFFIFRLRLRQAYRMLAEVGVLYLCVLLFFMSLMLLWWFSYLQKQQDWTTVAIPIAPALLVHFSRNDKAFLSHLNISKPILYSIEYLMANGMLIIALAFFQSYTTVLLALGITLCIPFLPQIKLRAAQQNWSYSFIPLTAYEWRMGFRFQGITLIFLYLFGLLASPFLGTLVLSVFLTMLVLPPFFDACEPKDWLNSKFSLWEKIYTHCILISLYFLPQYLLFLLFNFEYWYFAPILWVYSLLVMSFLVCYKYAAWSPNRLNVGIGTSAGVFTSMMLIPFVMPAGILMVLFYAKKARKNPFLR
jgi:hypothetical protein